MIDQVDGADLEKMPVPVLVTDTIMTDAESKARLAHTILDYAETQMIRHRQPLSGPPALPPTA